MRKWGSLAAFILIVLTIGMIIGVYFTPGVWYQSLEKPWFTPPNAIFAPVWITLYIIIAVVGWRTWQNDGRGALRGLWLAQMVLNFIWTPLFFGAHLTVIGFVVLLAVLVCVVAFIIRAWQPDRLSALLFMPYMLWLMIAAALNIGIIILN